MKHLDGHLAPGGDIRINGQSVRAGANTVTTRRQDRYSINTLSGHPAGISQGSLVALTGTQFPALLALKQGIDITPVVTSDGRVRLTIEQRFDEPAGRRSSRWRGTTIWFAALSKWTWRCCPAAASACLTCWCSCARSC